MNYISKPNLANIEYIGRNSSSSPATGHHKTHERELENVLLQTFK